VKVLVTEEKTMKTLRFLFPFVLLVIGASIPGTAKADTTFTLTNSGATAWLVAGFAGNNPALTLVRGQTYHFQVSVIGHPLFISTQLNSAAGPHFTTGVTNENVQNGTLDFVVPASAPATLFYQCGFHDGMSGQLNIVAASVPALKPLLLAALAALLAVVAVWTMRRRTRA
jgi:hypothetical protein